MTTKKLYLNNSYLREFTSSILSVSPHTKDPNYYLVQLDQTAFYPEGGGQPSDTGYIGNSQVSYVFEENDILYHVVDQPPSAHENVPCRIDWQRRHDHMQQHLGQHLLSAVFEDELKAATVGFHLGQELVTIDLDLADLSLDQAKRIENTANKLITQNLAVRLHYPDFQEVKKLPLRKVPSVTENIRIVEIDSYDFSPCGGTHPQSTGEVGLIKIRRWERLREGLRIEFFCGQRAMRDYQWKHDQINSLAGLFSIRDDEVQATVERLSADNKALSKAFQQQKRRLLEYRAQELYHDAEAYQNHFIVSKIFLKEDIKELQTMASILNQMPRAVILLATVNERAQIIFTRSKELKLDMNQLFKEVIPLIDGKGGGNAITAQGGGNLISNLEGLMEAAVFKLKKEYIKG